MNGMTEQRQDSKTAKSPVQKKESGGDGGGLKQQLRGLSFEEGSALLTPVQKKEAGNPPGGAIGKTEATDATEQTGDKEQIETHPPESLGKVGDMTEANSKVAGVIDAMLVGPGTGFKGSFELEIPFAHFGAGEAFAAVKFEGSAVHKKDGTKEVEFKSRLTLGGRIDLHIAEVSAGIFVEASTKSSAETFGKCMRLFGLLVHEKLRGISRKAASWVFGKAYEEDTLELMDEDDSVEGSAAAGLKFGAKAHGHGGHHGPEAELEGGYKTVTKLSKGEHGELEKETERGWFVNLAKLKLPLGAAEVEVMGEGFLPRDAATKKPKGFSGKLEVELMGEHGAFQSVMAVGAGLASIWTPAFNIMAAEVKQQPELVQPNIIEAAKAVPSMAIAGFLYEAELLKSGVAVVLNWKDGKWAGFEIEQTNKTEISLLGHGKIEGKKSRVLHEQHAGGHGTSGTDDGHH